MPKKAALFIGFGLTVIALLVLAAVLIGRLENQPEVTKTVAAGSAVTASVIYATSLPDLNGQPQAIGQWSQKLLVLNFWASWCAPCIEEIPILVRLQSKYGANGLQIVGIAADSAVNSAKFAQKLEINYPILADEIRALEFSKRAGNRLGLLPYTVVLNSRGDILLTKLGVVVESELEALIQRHLESAK